MTVKSAQSWAGLVVCRGATGALAAASIGPVGTLYVNGVANGAAVTVTGANPYKWVVTLPALTAGDTVSMYVTATVGGIATGAVVAEDVADTKRASDLNDLAAGAAMTLTAAYDAAKTAGSDPLTNAVPGAYASGSAGAALGRIAAASVTVTSPVSTDGATLALVAGDDYLAADARAIDWTDTGSTWPDLAGGATFYVGSFSKSLIVLSNVAPRSVRLELTAVETAALAGTWEFRCQAVDAHVPGHKVTFLTGTGYAEAL